jgi:hypothetical protein
MNKTIVKIYQHYDDNSEITIYNFHVQYENNENEIVFECIDKEIADQIERTIFKLLLISYR